MLDGTTVVPLRRLGYDTISRLASDPPGLLLFEWLGALPRGDPHAGMRKPSVREMTDEESSDADLLHRLPAQPRY
jgi:hypothetical protein